MINFKRGLQKALLLGLVGFLISTTLLCIPSPVPESSQSRREQQDMIKRNEYLIINKPVFILRSGLYCALVFALAAFTAYAPQQGVRFIRVLIIISSVTVLSIVVTGIYFPTRKGIAKSILIDPGIPITAAVLTMIIMVIFSVRNNVIETTETSLKNCH